MLFKCCSLPGRATGNSVCLGIWANASKECHINTLHQDLSLQGSYFSGENWWGLRWKRWQKSLSQGTDTPKVWDRCSVYGRKITSFPTTSMDCKCDFSPSCKESGVLMNICSIMHPSKMNIRKSVMAHTQGSSVPASGLQIARMAM